MEREVRLRARRPGGRRAFRLEQLQLRSRLGVSARRRDAVWLATRVEDETLHLPGRKELPRRFEIELHLLPMLGSRGPGLVVDEHDATLEEHQAVDGTSDDLVPAPQGERQFSVNLSVIEELDELGSFSQFAVELGGRTGGLGSFRRRAIEEL